jgi:hypothetical protein
MQRAPIRLGEDGDRGEAEAEGVRGACDTDRDLAAIADQDRPI